MIGDTKAGKSAICEYITTGLFEDDENRPVTKNMQKHYVNRYNKEMD